MIFNIIKSGIKGIKEKENINENKKDCGRILSKRNSPMVSLFENFYSVKPIKQINLDKFLLTSRFKAQVEKYRACSDPEKRRLMKGDLKCITPSGTFKERRESCIIKHTGLLCIDVDAKDNPMIDLENSKEIIGKHCPFLYYAGLSVSGEGIFLIFVVHGVQPVCFSIIDEEGNRAKYPGNRIDPVNRLNRVGDRHQNRKDADTDDTPADHHDKHWYYGFSGASS